jgi:hypothetical protein
MYPNNRLIVPTTNALAKMSVYRVVVVAVTLVDDDAFAAAFACCFACCCWRSWAVTRWMMSWMMAMEVWQESVYVEAMMTMHAVY